MKIKIFMTCLLMMVFFLGCQAKITEAERSVDTMQKRGEAAVLLATDLHFLSPKLYDDGSLFQEILAAGDGKMTTYSNEIVDAFLAGAVEQKPDCLILSGDLTYNGERESHAALIEKLYALEKQDIPVLVLPGNHDINSTGAARFEGERYTLVDSIDQYEFEEMYRDFGLNEALSRAKTSFSYVYDTGKGYWLLLLDVNTQERPGSVDDETLKWVEKQLIAAKEAGVHVVSASHQNLRVHNKMFGFGYQIYNGDALQKLYQNYGVVLNLSGHMHIQHLMKEDGIRDDVPEMATSSLTVNNCQYGSLLLKKQGVSYQAKQVDVASWAQKQEKADPNLLNFEQYAADYFDRAASGRREELRALKLSEQEIDRMLQYAALVNRTYFAGRLDLLPEDEEAEELWQAQRETTFFANYLNEIKKEGNQNNSILQIEFSE